MPADAEEKAEGLGITPFVIRTEEELLREIAANEKRKINAEKAKEAVLRLLSLFIL